MTCQFWTVIICCLIVYLHAESGRDAYLWKIERCHLQPFQCDVIEVDDVCEEFAEVADSILRSWEQDIVDDIHTVAIKKLKILITAIDRASAA